MASRNNKQGDTDTEHHNSQLQPAHTTRHPFPSTHSLDSLSQQTETGQERVGQGWGEEDEISSLLSYPWRQVPLGAGSSGALAVGIGIFSSRVAFLGTSGASKILVAVSFIHTTGGCTVKCKLEMHSWMSPKWSHSTNPCVSLSLSLSLGHTHKPPQGTGTEQWCQVGSVRDLLAMHRLEDEVWMRVLSSLSSLGGGEPFTLSPAGIWLFFGSNLSSCLLCYHSPWICWCFTFSSLGSDRTRNTVFLIFPYFCPSIYPFFTYAFLLF